MTDQDDDKGGGMPGEIEDSDVPIRRQLPPKQVSKLFRQSQLLLASGGGSSSAMNAISINGDDATHSLDNVQEGSSVQRNDHLHRLYLKEKLRRAVWKIKQQKQAAALAPGTKLEEHKEEEFGMEVAAGEDGALVQRLREEVEHESRMDALQGKAKEVAKLVREKFGDHFEMGPGFPLEVRIQNLSYSAKRPGGEDHGAGMKKIETVYNTSCVYNLIHYLRRVMRCQARQTRTLPSSEPFYMLHDINLVIQPGTQYLILGPPASGKTSLLRAIAGLIPDPSPKDPESLEGSILYNGRALKNSDGIHIDNAIRYIDQNDTHAARLTVEETFEFAFQCMTGGQIIREQDHLSAEIIRAADQANRDHLATKLVLTGLGLSEVANTFVGDTLVRGVSGGQRRRVTVGEMMMSRSPILCGDEISTGLDAASTYDTVQVLLHFARQHKMSRVIALLQPSPETVSLFDEVIVLAEGRIIFSGPIESVEDYFADLGFQCPPFTDVADFLQLVSTEDGAAKLYLPPPGSGLPPTAPSAEELESFFRLSAFGDRIQNQLKKPFKYVWKSTHGSGSEESGEIVSRLSEAKAVNQKYANNFFRSTQIIAMRFFILWLRDKRVIMASTVKNVLMGLSCGGIFFGTDNPISIQGSLFQAGMFVLLGTFNTCSTWITALSFLSCFVCGCRIGSITSSSGLVGDRMLFYKHADANFYSSWPYVSGRALAQIPQMAMFATFASESSLQVYGAVILLLGILFGGRRSVRAQSIPGILICASSCPTGNPSAWAYRALIVNEFRSGVWEDPDAILSQNGFVKPNGDPFEEKWVGYGCLYMLLYYHICCVFSALFLGTVRNTGEVVPPEKKPPIAEANSGNTGPPKVEIPFKPLTLSFHDLCYEVTASTSKTKLRLLKKVDGVFRPGRLCALMGSSGAVSDFLTSTVYSGLEADSCILYLSCSFEDT
eukprot:scaffold5169_cov172-Amphora_coffeaeformis.AAC.35